MVLEVSAQNQPASEGSQNSGEEVRSNHSGGALGTGPSPEPLTVIPPVCTGHCASCVHCDTSQGSSVR